MSLCSRLVHAHTILSRTPKKNCEMRLGRQQKPNGKKANVLAMSWQIHCPASRQVCPVVVINIVVVVVLFVVLAEATATAKAADKQFVGLRLGFRLALRHSGRGQASKLTCIRFMNTVLTASVQPQKCEPLVQRLELWLHKHTNTRTELQLQNFYLTQFFHQFIRFFLLLTVAHENGLLSCFYFMLFVWGYAKF